MSKSSLRHDHTCQNCGETGEKSFCGNCGQKNTETRQSFIHLIRHFIEDVTHYDGKFWLTMKYLLFRPAFLTKEYLLGKRMSYVPPVRLYIFISFVTFLLPYLLPDAPDSIEYTNKRKEKSDSIVHKETVIENLVFNFSYELVMLPHNYRTVEQLDSVQMALVPSKRMSLVNHWLQAKYIGMGQYSPLELGDKFFDSFFQNFPKILFVFMPLFALVLWLFHGKKRWLYFDHAIFTLHYFSFILLVFNLLSISDEFFFLGEDVGGTISGSIFIVVALAVFIYFFMAHKGMYGETKLISFVKSLLIYATNLLLFFMISVVMALITLFSIH